MNTHTPFLRAVGYAISCFSACVVFAGLYSIMWPEDGVDRRAVAERMIVDDDMKLLQDQFDLSREQRDAIAQLLARSNIDRSVLYDIFASIALVVSGVILMILGFVISLWSRIRQIEGSMKSVCMSTGVLHKSS